MERHRKTLARWTTQATELTLNQELGRGAFGIDLNTNNIKKIQIKIITEMMKSNMNEQTK